MLGKSAYEIENTFTMAELDEWGEYLQDNPTPQFVAETQRAMIAQAIASQYGAKTSLDDFIVSGKKETQQAVGIHEMTEEEINAIAGV